jgi:hypothetical protein
MSSENRSLGESAYQSVRSQVFLPSTLPEGATSEVRHRTGNMDTLVNSGMIETPNSPAALEQTIRGVGMRPRRPPTNRPSRDCSDIFDEMLQYFPLIQLNSN